MLALSSLRGGGEGERELDPPADLLPSFRPTMLEYYDALAGVATGLARPLFVLGEM